MPMLKAPRKITRRQELRQDAVVSGFARLEALYENYRNYLIGAAVVLLIVIFAGIGFSFWRQSQGEKAAELLGGIVRLYEQGQYRQALDGTAEAPGLLEIADKYGSVKDGNLANFYAADALFRLGEKEEALRYFRRFDKASNFVGASAYAGEAAIEEDLGNHERAARLYERAADVFVNDVTSPVHLLNAARNYEMSGNYREARAVYTRVLEEYPEAGASRKVEILLARVESKVN